MTLQLRQKYPDLPIISRARDADHAAALYQAGASDAVPETLESSLQLAEAVLIDLGVAMGPVIASIHDIRAKMRHDIMTKGKLEREPRIRRTRRHAPDGEATYRPPTTAEAGAAPRVLASANVSPLGSISSDHSTEEHRVGKAGGRA